jgi:myo-inositol catabolism protein IolC
MRPGFEGTVFILAFDHRGSFVKKFFGIQGQPTAEQTAQVMDAKKLIYEGFLRAIPPGPGKSIYGVLVDEQFGKEIALDAKAQGFTVAIPVEKSGQDEFDFEYGSAFGDHVLSLEPTFVKVLVRFNPQADGAANGRQAAKLRTLSDWLHARDHKFLFELLVPAQPHQLDEVGDDADRYDRELRPGLMRTAISHLQSAGVEPDVWKIEGLDRREDCIAIANQCMVGGRDGVKCVVLGRGADGAVVDGWLKTGATVPGYAGFAIGRSIWWEPLKAFVDGGLVRASAASQIENNFKHFVNVYRSAAAAS